MILIRYVCLSLALVQCSADAHPLWFMLEDPDDILAAYRLSNQLRQWQTRFSQLPSISDPYFQQSPGSSTSQWIFPSQQTSPQQSATSSSVTEFLLTKFYTSRILQLSGRKVVTPLSPAQVREVFEIPDARLRLLVITEIYRRSTERPPTTPAPVVVPTIPFTFLPSLQPSSTTPVPVKETTSLTTTTTTTTTTTPSTPVPPTTSATLTTTPPPTKQTTTPQLTTPITPEVPTQSASPSTPPSTPSTTVEPSSTDPVTRETPTGRDTTAAYKSNSGNSAMAHLRAGLADILCAYCQQRNYTDCVIRYCNNTELRTTTGAYFETRPL